MELEKGFCLIQTPVKVESSPPYRHNYKRRRQLKCNQDETMEYNAVATTPTLSECNNEKKLQENPKMVWNLVPKVDGVDVPAAPGTPDKKNVIVYHRRGKLHVEKIVLVYHRRRKHVKKQPSFFNKLICRAVGAKKRVRKRMAKPVVVKSKHTRKRKQNMIISDYEQQGMLVPYNEIVHPKMKSISKVELDERTVREWEMVTVEKLDSGSIGIEEGDQGEREWWEKERELFDVWVKSFISKMNLIQGERKFSQWKGSVTDSVGGAYLTQNVNDTLSSSAFMSLAAKYPLGAARVNSHVETSIDSSISKPNSKNASRSSSSKTKNDKILPTICLKKKRNAAFSSKGKQVKIGDMTQIIFRRKGKKKDILKKYNSRVGSRNKTYDTLDALDWEAVRIAKIDDIAKAIEKRGMNNNLAARIKNFLNILAKDLGSVNLEWIRDVPPHIAKEYLLSIPGMGLKSVECIRLLTLLQKAFPIDRNAGRVAVRLGWVPLQPLPEGQEFHLLKEYPKVNPIQMYLWPRLCKHDPSILYELHCHMITFGKVFCTKRNPNCNACPMRAECKHYASALASSQLSLPAIQEKNDMHSGNHVALAESLMVSEAAMVPLLEGNCTTSECVTEAEPASETQSFSPRCLQMVEVQGPEAIEWDIEDFGLNGTPRVSKELMVLTPEPASIPVPKLKNLAYLRTEHQVYVLPDLHHVLAGVEEREPNDLSPYLLAIWTSENVNYKEEEEDTVNGTLLIPARTAVRGIFPLNGTYFQSNEVFADDESSEVPIKVPREWLWYLRRTTLYCGNNISAVCKGMKSHEVQNCFKTGYVCFRGFNRKTREAKTISERFHLPEKWKGKKKKHTKENDA